MSWQLFKATLGLALLLLLVVCVGVLAHHLLLRAPYGRLAGPTDPPPVEKPTSKRASQVRASQVRATHVTASHAASKKPVRYKVPPYEIFDPDTPATSPPKPATPPSGGQQPLVAIIVDDLGYDLKLARRYLEMEGPLTFSMLPQGPFTAEIVAEAHARGHEIMLHLPMEPMEYPQISPGPGALLAEMPPDQLLAQLDTDLAAIPYVKGVNNHMGSRLSAQAPQMRQIFSRLKARGLYYVDSRTTKETVGRPSAERLRLPFAERDIFIDHYQDADFIRKQLRLLVKRAYAQGYAIGIAHPHPLTIELMRDALPQLKDQVTLVPASRVVQEAG
ncbi:MAG: divergent polysaccharide deacetylase family protein [Desulfosarcinaceae bacterium]